MIHNYLLVAFRNFNKHRLFSFISICGLAIGLVCAVLIGLFVQQELSFDRWLPNSQNLYRISVILSVPGQHPQNFGAAPTELGPTMAAEIPGVQESAYIVSRGVSVRFGSRQYAEWINAVSANFFTVIRLPFAFGDSSKALMRPDSVVLSQSIAEKYFGKANPIGKILLFDGKTARTVTGVIRDLPYNTQFNGEIFIPYQSPTVAILPNGKPDPKAGVDPYRWVAFESSTYIRLAPGVDPRQIEKEIPLVFIRHLSPELIAETAATMHSSMDKLISAKLVPLYDVHFTNPIASAGIKTSVNPITIYSLASIALLVLMTAGFNYTNLATARATMRAKEIGLRKVVGSSRGQLIAQFLVEAVVMSLLALAIAFAISEILLPSYSAFLGHRIVLDYIGNWPFIIGAIGIAILTGLLGGLYPAFVLSRFHPAAVLRRVSEGGRAGHLRTLLVLLQFSVSIGLGIVSIVTLSQAKYAQKLDLGFNLENVVAMSIFNSDLTPEKVDSLQAELANDPNISDVALSNKSPGDENINLAIVGIPYTMRDVSVQTICVSPNFFSVYDIKLKAGRFLSRNRMTDIHYADGSEDKGNGYYENGKNIVIDETAARAFGYAPDKAVGKTVTVMGGRMTIVGVVRNALFSGAKAVQTAPIIYFYNPKRMSSMSIKIKQGRTGEALTRIDGIWRRHVPDKPAIRSFIDDRMNALYADIERQGMLMSIFVALAIVIACLGLFGLAAFTVERRTKEIGIRKVFGASTCTIVRLLLLQYTLPVIAANLIAWPAAYFYLRHWLDSFAYRIDLSPAYFLSVSLAALLIAWGTVAAHTISVARKKPVAALRYE